MGRLRLAAAMTLLAVLVVGFNVKPAVACSCAGSQLADYADDVTLAFSGQQISRVVNSEVAANGAILVFEVDQVFKGEVEETVVVHTEAQSSACGMDFSGNAMTGVAVFTWRGQLTVNLCGSSVTVDELTNVFGEGSQPLVDGAVNGAIEGSTDEASAASIPAEPDSSIGWLWFALPVVGLVLAGFTAFAVRTRR